LTICLFLFQGSIKSSEDPGCLGEVSYGIIGIEDLYLKGLLKNRRLSRSFSDAALGKLLNLLTRKVEQRGGQVIKVDRFFPSSKTFHGCGWKWEEMELSDRIFICQNPTCAY
jgi:putative transposase